MIKQLTVSVRQGKSGYEGTVQLPGLKSTKLTRKDGSTTFPSSSAVKTVARIFGENLGLEVSYSEPASKKLAKKTIAATTAKKTTAKKTTAKKTTAKKSTAKSAKTACPSSTSTSTNS